MEINTAQQIWNDMVTSARFFLSCCVLATSTIFLYNSIVGEDCACSTPGFINPIKKSASEPKKL